MRIGIDYTTGVYGGTGIGRYTRGLAHALAAIDRENEYTLLWARANGPDHTSPYDIGHMFAPCLGRMVAALASRNAESCDDLRPLLPLKGSIYVRDHAAGCGPDGPELPRLDRAASFPANLGSDKQRNGFVR